MKKIYLLLGSNMSDKQKQIEQAELLIAGKLGPLQDRSSLYETEPWGFESRNNFLNRVVSIETDQSPEECLAICLSIEKEMGRERHEGGYSSRIIDIDILFFHHAILDLPGLKIPHPRLHQRRFVLEPLKELAPNFIHPVLHKSIQQLWQECQDKCWVRKL